MIKSKEEFNKIVKSVKKYSGVDGYLKYFDDESLGRVIRIWNSEKDNITNPDDLRVVGEFCFMLKSLRRLLLNGRDEDFIPMVEWSELLNRRIERLKEFAITIKRGDTFRCKKDVIINGDVIYRGGKVYVSDIDHCITDEEGDACDEWDTFSLEFSDHFEVCTDSDIKPNKLVELRAGDQFRCIKNYYDKTLDIIIFFSGNIYESIHDGYLFDGTNMDIGFSNMILPKFSEYFIKV